jgi:hypothetical protein
VDELLIIGEPGVHDLEGYRPIQPGVDRIVDSGHPAAGDPSLDVVAAVDHPTDKRIGNGRIHGKGVYGR